MRVVSLLPSATDILAELDALDLLVGDTPDVVLAGADWTGDPATRVVPLDPRSIEDVFEDVLAVAEAIGRPEAGEAAMVRLRGRYWTAVDYVNPFVDGPEVAFLEGMDPLVAGGRWTPGLIRAAGGRCSLNEPDAMPRQVTPDELVAAAPELLVVCPRGDAIDATTRELATLTSAAWWPQLPAVRTGRVALVDGTATFNRPGPRLVEAFRWLVGWINGRPEVIPEGFPAREASALRPKA